MVASVSEQCRACVTTLKTVISSLSESNTRTGPVRLEHVNDALEKFSLWMGNIGALHVQTSSMSLESRLQEAKDVLTHILELLTDLDEVGQELLSIVSGERQGEVAAGSTDNLDEEDQSEETELLQEISACITRLFRVSSLIRQAAPTDLFAKALSRNRYRFNDQFDIAHVGEKYPKLTTTEYAWLQKRLGRAITQRRHYLSYVQDHREALEGMLTLEEADQQLAPEPKPLPIVKQLADSSSQPSTFFTKASTLLPGHITSQMLTVEEESDPENDARSYTTISRSVDGDLDSSATVRIPKLDQLRTGPKNEVECPFCFRMKKFKNERVWRRHVFSDLRPYLCTYPDCDAPYFGDINEWFRHEMQNHRVSYTCRLCQHKTFQLKERYLAHVRKHHPDMLEDGEQQSLISIARKPLDHIPASDCPCCSDWVDRLKERTMVVNSPSNPPDQIVSVVPAVFKRHLASHMEQLALFAIPLSVDNEKADSNAAIEDDVDALPGNLDQSTLTFPSSRPSSPASSEGLSDITRNRQDSSKTRDKEERGLRPGKYVESDDDHSEGSETAVNRKPGTLSSPRQANISAKRSHLSDLGIDRPSSADNMTGQQPDWATFHNVQMKDLEDVDSKEIERQGILHVIVQSEEAYVTRLDLLYTGFRDRLISAQPPVIDPNRLDGFIRVVLGKVDAVKRANEDHLLPQMRYRQQEQSPWIIGYSDIFREWVKIAEQAYFAYATALPDANFLIRQEADKNVAFQGFLDATRSLSKQNWNKLLNAPLTQIREYTLFLERVFHLSAPDSEECLNLRCAINEIKDIASRCELVATAKTRPEWYYSSDGTVDAPYPEPVTHTPPPPLWLSKELAELKKKYPNGLFEATMRYVITDQATMASIKVDRNSPLPQNAKSQYAPRIRCLDCPGKLYTAGPGQTLENFEVHLSNRLHTANVEMRLVSEELVKVLELSPEDESKLKLSSGEKLYFSHLFALADTEKLGVVTGERALRFFESTEVANEVLGEMWQIVDSENRGLLTPFGFCQFLRLVGHYQDGRNPTLEATSIPGPAPKFKGITNPFVSDVKDPAFTDSLSDVEIDSVQPTRGDAVDSTHKSANEDRTGPQVLFESMKDVLMELKACEQAHPFLQHVNETEAPEYYTVIKHPMAISTVMEKLQERRYRSKHEFGDDLMLIWANCLKYNADPAHPLREKALYMKNETEKLVPLIPNIFIRDYAEAKTGAKGEPQDATVLGTEKRSSSPTPLGYERLADDPFPYPAFLRYTKEEAQLKFVDLEWEQRKRLASGVKEADASPWVRVDQSLTKNRNRYANVDPYANNRVKLKVPEPYNDYINASPIELVSSKSKTVTKFIATQGPKQDTISHFWRMVWDETNSYAEIIMLTQTHESGREKCYSYFPRSHEDEQLRINEHDEFEDGMVYDIVLEDLREYHAVSSHVRDIAMIHFNTSERKRIRHYLFNGWPDFAVPEGNDRRALIELIKMSRKEMGDNFANPRVVHDSAGVGRTGTFIALDWLLQELEEGSLDHLDDDQDPIAEVVDRLRQQRMMMVQGESQFVFLYDVIRGQWRERWIKLHPDEAERLIKPHHEKLTVRGGINLGSELQEVSLEEEFREGESPSRYHRGRGIAVSAKRARKEGNVY